MCSKKEYNLMILHAIEQRIQEYPELRFIQLLWTLGICSAEDRFYEESEATLKKVLERVEKKDV